MLELILGVLLAAGASFYVLLPILRPTVEPEATGTRAFDEGDDPEDDMSPQTVALRALKEIEFDRATGKLSDADYDALKAKYTEEAVAAMRGEARVHPASRTSHPACSEHGPRPEPDAVFCSECGRRLGSAPAYCTRCGSALADDSRYCNRCGTRVAA